jgi:hypothetical protein
MIIAVLAVASMSNPASAGTKIWIDKTSYRVTVVTWLAGTPSVEQQVKLHNKLAHYWLNYSCSIHTSKGKFFFGSGAASPGQQVQVGHTIYPKWLGSPDGHVTNISCSVYRGSYSPY